jgi:hypothetical protein
MKIITIKQWCDENITPLAWQRVVMKNLDALKSTGLNLNELNNPSENAEISEELFELIKQTIKETYQLELPL